MIVGRPIRSVRFVTLLTRQLVSTSAPDPPVLPITKAKMRFPIPEQYGITNVPNTVPSSPLAFKASNLQIIRNEQTRKSPTNSQGANPPAASIHVTTALKPALVRPLISQGLPLPKGQR